MQNTMAAGQAQQTSSQNKMRNFQRLQEKANALMHKMENRQREKKMKLEVEMNEEQEQMIENID